MLLHGAGGMVGKIHSIQAVLMKDRYQQHLRQRYVAHHPRLKIGTALITDHFQLSVSSPGTPVKASLSSRLGVFVEPNATGSHGVPNTSSPNAHDRGEGRSMDASERSQSSERKRGHDGESYKYCTKLHL